jgi:hypothetical protein
MRKLISATMMVVLVSGFGLGISGCSEEASETSKVITKSPEGTTTQTVKKSTETSGKNPPAPTTTP